MKLQEYCEHINKRREALLKKPNDMDAYLLSFDAHNILVTIHPWVDGNGRMSRLITNYLQFEFGLIPSKVVKEDKAAYIEALNKSREYETMIPFQEFMLQEHAKNLRNEILEYKKTVNEDVKVNQIGGPKTREAILQLIANNEFITSRDMASLLNINRSAISKHLKKMQEENIILREGSLRAGRWVIISKS